MKFRGMSGILGWIASIGVMIAISLACFIPTWIFFLIRYFLKPSGFWQNFVVFGAGVWFLGAFQFVGFILFCMFWYYILFEMGK